MTDFVKILLNLEHSIIVLSVDSSRIVIQFRIKEIRNNSTNIEKLTDFI